MQKRSHLQLARALLRQNGGFAARRYEWAFLFGSFEPDINPFSYLKGSMGHKKFGGHTYGNNREYIFRRAGRLRQRDRWGLWHYYTLGKLSHYVADAFTWPHNPHFPDRGWAHHVYETELRAQLSACLAETDPYQAHPVWDLPMDLEVLHDRYLSETDPGLERDIQYILYATALLMANCRPVHQDEEEGADGPVPETA